MQIVPVQDVAAQTFSAQLGGQNCQLTVYQLNPGQVGSDGHLAAAALYMDVLVDNAPIITGVACEYRNRIVRGAYLGFIGDLFWEDTQGTSRPLTPGLGTRFQLIYLEPADVAGR